MKGIIATFCLCVLTKGALGIHYKENITDFSRCRTDISRGDGKYTQFYEINTEQGPENGSSLVLDFHFAVMASSNAHILLSESEEVGADVPVYEIVIEAGVDDFCAIRRKQRTQDKVIRTAKDLLSAVEPHSFWIHVWNDGLIELGRETEELAIVAWTDPEPLNLKFFSFSTWVGIEAKWFFDCQRNLVNKTDVLISGREKLIKDLFKNYNIFSGPSKSETTSVELHLIPQYISLDMQYSSVTLKGTGKMKWRDQRLTWNPAEYNGIKRLVYSCWRIWTPILKFQDYNIIELTGTIEQNGTVCCDLRFDIDYWCHVEDLSTWPEDEHNCSVNFYLMKHGNAMDLQFKSDIKDFFRLPTPSEWTVTHVEVNNETTTNETFDYIEDEKTPSVFLSFGLKRASSAYKSIFLTPFFMISISSLCVFCTSPFGYLKISLCCIHLIIESVIIICISHVIPGHSTSVPALVALYRDLFASTVILVIISIVVINLSRSGYKTYSVPNWLYNILSSKKLENLLLLPSIEEKPLENDTNQDTSEAPWITLGILIDRIAFISYSIFFIIISRKV